VVSWLAHETTLDRAQPIPEIIEMSKLLTLWLKMR